MPSIAGDEELSTSAVKHPIDEDGPASARIAWQQTPFANSGAGAGDFVAGIQIRCDTAIPMTFFIEQFDIFATVEPSSSYG